ncbi:fibronectin type III domain-containing protein [Lactococcus lactis]|uniref:fibronectin type III domain-containing protein n=1 Tax=Lactococcus lactis TaxID=1358 RepID=UPI001485D6E5|nr:fibronectin type III domain-containing protein [Lactococcus lactis]
MADKNYLHTAYAYSADGTDRFTTVYPNLNLLDGTKDFSGNWLNSGTWYKNGTYRGLTVMSFNTGWNGGLCKTFNIPSDGIYSMSMLVKVKTGSIGQFVIESTGKPAIIKDIPDTSGEFVTQSYTGTFTTGQTVTMYFRFNNNATTIKDGLSVAGHKIEPGSTATPWMPSSSEVTTADWPKYVGTYVDTNPTSSTDPSKYDWDEMKYRVYLDGIPVGGSKLLSFDLKNLKAGTTYNVQVSQINGNIESDKSESVAFKTTLTQ